MNSPTTSRSSSGQELQRLPDDMLTKLKQKLNIDVKKEQKRLDKEWKELREQATRDFEAITKELYDQAA